MIYIEHANVICEDTLEGIHFLVMHVRKLRLKCQKAAYLFGSHYLIALIR